MDGYPWSITAVTFGVLETGALEVLTSSAHAGYFPRILHWPQEYDGIFVMDSFAKIKGPKSWEKYMAEILVEVWKATNMKCLAVVLGGARFADGSYDRMLTLIRRNFPKPSFMVWISMGNDLYPLDRPHVRQSFLYDSTTYLLQVAARWVPEQRMVFGGSSGVWGYMQSFSPYACEVYDLNCINVKAYVRLKGGFSCITGGNIFEGMVMSDRIGRVSVESMPILKEAFRILSKWGMTQSPPWYRRWISRLRWYRRCLIHFQACMM